MRFALLFIALLAPCLVAVPARALTLAPCHLAAAQSPQRISAQCGRFEVAEDRDAPGGRFLSLAVAVLPATTHRRAADPLVFITGGPGQSALESYVLAHRAFARINRHRDIVLLDQRGTGDSNPLHCPLPDDWQAAALSSQAQRELALECLQALPGDPRFYTTSVAIRDLAELLTALDYERVNLYGISYGSRVAQAFARAWPERTRSVILDGVVPLDRALGPDISLDAQRALDMMFRRCAGDRACRERFPRLAGDFRQLQRGLREAPVTLTLADPATAELSEHTFTEDWLRGVVRMFSYAPGTVALLPLLIDRAVQEGDFAPLAAQAVLLSRQLEDALAAGMHNAVVCTEDLPFIAAAGDDVDDRADTGEDTYLGVGMLESLRAACSVWPRGELDSGFRAPWRSAIPTLILSGEADPVTPPDNGEHLLRSLDEALHVVGPGQGHGMYARGCTPRIMEDFIASASIAGLEVDCIQRLRPAPFFLSFTGPTP
ncbi:alpha/beta hydrolase [Kineobactrum salinum]|uniref:Alpha/beta hydrolase n=1 Tax=Kineobactrum salinum TaxID=2708301 RepID=A0A6C0TXX5_9GAMM|nr:alpha/beta hydrolase [Kineobactrum salinum]QIB64682.1 alpha/beta hydrolase [Kineobactrum salinum]